MIQFIKNILLNYDINENLSLILSNIIAVGIIIIICFIVDIITKRFLLRILRTYISKSKVKWNNVLLNNKVFDIIARIPPALVVHAFAPVFPIYQDWIQRIAFAYIVINVVLAIGKTLDSVNDIYRDYEVSRIRPIKGYLQVVKIIISVAAAIVIISALIDRSPWILLSGLGAATAVIVLIFQNSILGFVASIQLATNDMVQIGDWIEMPSHGANGDVIDISLHTVKVQNFDKTIITIPTHLLISESFKNWRGMQESGGRRIKRAIYIDINSIKFCDEEMLEKFEEIQYIKEYINGKRKKIEDYNQGYDMDSSNIVNGKHLANIGVFRAYIENYLKNHSKISKDMTQMVRQLQPTENGVPIEIYAFTKGTEWTDYEKTQSDIFDHLLTIIHEFDLKIYQRPTGNDLRNIKMN